MSWRTLSWKAVGSILFTIQDTPLVRTLWHSNFKGPHLCQVGLPEICRGERKCPAAYLKYDSSLSLQSLYKFCFFLIHKIEAYFSSCAWKPNSSTPSYKSISNINFGILFLTMEICCCCCLLFYIVNDRMITLVAWILFNNCRRILNLKNCSIVLSILSFWCET